MPVSQGMPDGGTGLKVLLWTVTAALALLWSLGLWLAVQLMDVLMGLWPAAGLPAVLPGQVNWPAWLALWWPKEELDALLSFLQWLASLLAHVVPSAATLHSLVGMGVWLVWGLGMSALLVVAVGLHVLLGRSGARPRRAA
jgi:hypothetical protein